MIAFATGARHTAILDLTWDRVDFVAGTIEFDERLPRDPMSRSWRKARATVPMNRAVRAALELAYRRRQTDHVIEHGAGRLKTVRAGFFNAVERAGLGEYRPHPTKKDVKVFHTEITPHTIRHTVLTWLDESNVETRRAAQLAGHKDERTTKITYTHASPDVLKAAVDILGDAFTPLPRIGHLPEPGEEGEDPESGENLRRLSQRDENDDAREEA